MPVPQPIRAAWPGPQFGSWNGEGEEEGREAKGVHCTSPPFAALLPQPPSPPWARDAAAGVTLGPQHSVGERVGRGALSSFFQ